MIKKFRNQIQKLNKIQSTLDVIHKQNDEILFANIFRDTIHSSAWLKDKSFSPYRSAANYSLLYKLYRIYDIFQPKNTLEFGLGQTTKITAQYVATHQHAQALVIDDSQEWIDIFKAETNATKRLKVTKLSLRDFRHKNVRVENAEYDQLEKTIKKEKFNLVIVDGPIGYNKHYSRTNILGIVGNLDKEWVVIFDDAERDGEQNTIGLFKEELAKMNIEYAEFTVSAMKTQHYFCSNLLGDMLINI